LQTHIFNAFSRVFQTVVVFAGLAGLARAGVTLNVSPSPTTFGAPVTLTATITPATATGKVTFYDGAVVLGTASISGGVATLNVPLNATGTRSLIARYLGDSSNSASVSSVVSETVKSIPAFGFVPTNINFGTPVQNFAIGDFNGDGKADLAVVGDGNFIAVALGNGDGTFATPIKTQVNVTGTLLSIVAGDFNGDGKIDVAVGNGYVNYGNAVNSVEVLLGNGDGTFGSQSTYSTDDGEMVVADFNLDGIPDLVIVHPYSFGIFLGKGDGTFAGPVEYSAGGTPSTVAVGDVNGDGKPDLVTIVPTANTQGSLIAVLIGNGDGTFSAPNTYTLFGSTPVEEFDQAIVLADFNGDGKLDLAIAADFAHGVWLCLGNGDGTFAPVVTFNAGGQDEGSGVGIVAVDVNGDQKLDIVANFNLRSALSSGLFNELQTFYGNGDGTFQPVQILAAPLTNRLFKLIPADFNGDGRVDLMSWGADSESNPILRLFSGSVIPELTVTSTHAGNLTPGQKGAAFTVVVTNAIGAAATTGTVTVGYYLGGLLTLESIVGTGWACSNSLPVCTRNDALAPGASYPPITVTADVVLTAAPGPDGNFVMVSGGGSQFEEVTDSTMIVPLSAGCSYSLTASSVSISADSTASAVGVTTAAGCNWLAGSNTPWLTISSGASGSGNGSVNFVAGPNPVSQPRSGTLTVAGQTFTVNQAAPTIAPAGINPSAGSALSQTFTFTFTDAAGYADLSVLDVLVSTFLDGQTACYFALAPTSATTGYIYLVDDAGDGGYAGAPMPLPSAGVVQNSQCSISGAGSSVSASGNTLTLTLAITFKASFAGNKAFYMAARSNTQNSGWQVLGSWNVPNAGVTGPAVGTMSPGRSNTNIGTYTFTFTDTNGFADLFVLDVLINGALDGTNACYFAYVPTSATTGYLYLVDDGNDGRYVYGSPVAVPGNYGLQNNQCFVSSAVATASNNTLTLTLQLTFNMFNFAGNQVFYVAARNNSTGNSGWQAVGSVTVP
jgi:Bacterial Ig-like domain (group 3)/FG-GAP-like repeat/Putative binding domain, N-terminal